MQYNKEHSTAILIFANSPNEELKYKPIAKDGALFEALTQRTLKVVKRTKLPYFHITEKQQHGISFGERFVNAVQMVFDKGFDTIITIGNDTPLLKTKHLVRAHHVLLNKRPVLGISADGGFYLLGLHRLHFDALALKALPWQTSCLSRKLKQLFSISSLGIVHLPTLYDLDNASDLKILGRFVRGIGSCLGKIIIFLNTLPKETVFDFKFNFVETSTVRIPFNKGSPFTI